MKALESTKRTAVISSPPRGSECITFNSKEQLYQVGPLFSTIPWRANNSSRFGPELYWLQQPQIAPSSSFVSNVAHCGFALCIHLKTHCGTGRNGLSLQTGTRPPFVCNGSSPSHGRSQ